VRECRHCGSRFEERFRFCPWCGAAQRLKIVEYFPAQDGGGDGEEGPIGLRVSRYLAKPGHVRFSIWKVAEVQGAISLDEHEARRLASFIQASDPGGRARLARRLRVDAERLLQALR
jgi:hypothetical protein